jgi:tetratricopeptide (TPR) repeat protein
MYQAKYLAQINRLQSLTNQVAFWEKSDSYRKAIDAYKSYVDYIRTLNDPKKLINAYIRMAQFCENMEDRLFASDLYQEAIVHMEHFGVDSQHIQNVHHKIHSLSWY